jgi:hypothetical protein
MGIEPREQEGKSIYPLKLECHNCSYLCTKQNKEICEIDLKIECNKVIKARKLKDVSILNNEEDMTKVAIFWKQQTLGSWSY